VDSRLTRISTPDRKRLGTVRVGVGVQSLAVGFGTLWVAKQKTRSLLRLDPVTGDPKGPRFVLPDGLPIVVATGQGGVWVALRAPGRIVRLDPVTGAVDRQLDFPDGVQDMTVGEDAVWVVSRTRQLVTRVDPNTAEARTVRVGAAPRGIAVGDGFVWVCNSAEASVTRIDPATLRVRGTFRTGDTPTGIDIGGGSVWISNRVDGTITRLSSTDPPRPLETIRGFTNPFAVAARGKDVWVTDPTAGVVGHLAH
jgi:streptogramin lyase